jgi:hypothetical protein
MPPMLSIDFGNSYTKVALRQNPNGRAEPLKDGSLVWDEFNLCVPTLAMEQTVVGYPTWYYGTDVAKFAADTPNLTIHRNWKPHFFDKGTVTTPCVPVTAGARRAARPAPPGITPEAWAVMSAKFPKEQLEQLWLDLGGTDSTDEGEEEVTELEHKAIGLGFFRWLREFVDPVCLKRIGRPAADVPARISLPSFGNMTKAELLLREILSEAGWKLDDTAPVLPEPLSNAIGTFTEGANATRQGAHPDYASMFHNTGMLNRMRDAILKKDGVKSAWALIVDVGGYTTDFAMVGIDLQDIDARLEGEIDDKKRLAHQSKPLGVSELDRRLLEVLPEGKRDALREVLANQERFEAFHRSCYGKNHTYVLKRTKIGATATEKKLVADVVQKFADEAADDAETFLEINQYDQIDDLILTGGGTLIPKVRDALCARLSRYAKHGLKAHTNYAEGERLPGVKHPHKLPLELVRGATAVGGASVYFDFADRE